MIKQIIITLFVAVFMVSCMGSAGVHYQMDNTKKEKMHQDMGGGY